MINFIIDIGNTRIKAASFEGYRLEREWVLSSLDELIQLTYDLDFNQAIVSSVTWSEEILNEKLPFRFLYFNPSTPLPIRNGYRTPHTLGLDRLAAAVATFYMNPEGRSMAIDVGTCITYDLVSEDREYTGGAISPGIRMRFESMHSQTARLPLVSWPVGHVSLVGNDTVSCMQSGVYFGVCHEIEGMIHAFSQQFPGLKVFICGGDAKSFEYLTKDHIFVIPNLVLYGLNRILIYNVSNKTS